MRRDMDLIRHLLLLIEDQGSDMNSWIEDTIVEGHTEEEISHHIWLLSDGGFIDAIDLSTMECSSFKPRCLTWQGHEFLDAVRDKDIWSQTLDLAKHGGTNSLTALFDIAKFLVRKRIEKLLDIA